MSFDDEMKGWTFLPPPLSRLRLPESASNFSSCKGKEEEPFTFSLPFLSDLCSCSLFPCHRHFKRRTNVQVDKGFKAPECEMKLVITYLCMRSAASQMWCEFCRCCNELTSESLNQKHPLVRMADVTESTWERNEYTSESGRRLTRPGDRLLITQ